MKEIEITTEITGYPRGLHTGYIGFDSFEEAEKFANENNGSVVELTQRAGWQFWVSRGREYEPLTVTAEKYGMDYHLVKTAEEWKEECYSVLNLLIEAGAELTEIADEAKEMEEIERKINNMEDDEAALFCCGNFVEIIKTKTMHYEIDSEYHEIGVEIWEK